MGGSDDNDNLVRLTGREHWVAHLLLYKMHQNQQCLNACHIMAMKCEERGIPQIRNSRMYEAIRIDHAKLTSRIMKTFIGEKNSQFGTMWISDGVTNRKIKKNETIPPGWQKGRSFSGKLNPPRKSIPGRTGEWTPERKARQRERMLKNTLTLGRKHREESLKKMCGNKNAAKHKGRNQFSKPQ